ncbi:MAG: hypothetical protein JZU52_04220 [Lamprocystis purpurea]|jgi:ribosomal protein S16|uniref:hypothetical protein n=1 Tax=Lamprocystis purpurea TaxID=61598 RepID=UPI00036BCA63|nr:hypothetical protein [Lamprocystis purpurea]MBV5272864.1 hypothetical protein [Lamprocystis purpurea]
MTIFVRRVKEHPGSGGASRRRSDIFAGDPGKSKGIWEKIGSYTPGANGDPDSVTIDCDTLDKCIRAGHRPSPQVRKLAKTHCPGIDLNPETD